MNIQQLINKLNAIQDKTLPVYFESPTADYSIDNVECSELNCYLIDTGEKYV